MVHCLITDKENYCALRPIYDGGRTTDSGFYSQFMLLSPPSYIKNRSNHRYPQEVENQKDTRNNKIKFNK